MNTSPEETARGVALSLLTDIEERGSYANVALSARLDARSLSREDRALCSRLVYGVTEKKVTLDYVISKLSSRPTEQTDLHTLSLLRLGLYQLMYADRIPDRAAVYETVELASGRGEAGFVNACLRSYQRAQQSGGIAYPLRTRDGFIKYASVRWSFPENICETLMRDYGENGCGEILSALSAEPPLTLCANLVKISRQELLASFAAAGIAACPSPLSPAGITVTEKIPFTSLPGFAEGLFFAMDESSQLASCVLGAQAGETVADICACPGGKSFCTAALMGDSGRILAFDLHANKLSLIESGARRLGLSSVTAAARDAKSGPSAENRGKCDRLICDAPCSGLGVMAKKPDLRYKAADAFARLPSLQYDILSAGAYYLRIGGVGVYSTCTLRRAENTDVFSRFLASHPDFAPLDFTVGDMHSENGALTVFPDGVRDGFFIARFERTR